MNNKFSNSMLLILQHLFLVGVCGLAMTFARLPYALADSSKQTEIDYLRDIQPIFAERCFTCHGPEEQESGLRLDDRVSLLAGGDWGEPTIVPGHSDESFLIRVVSGEESELVMPPEDEPLSVSQIKLLRAWIDQGAAMPKNSGASQIQHWSLQPISDASIPAIKDPWIANPIDAFVLARLREAGMEPSPRAEPRVLARRTFITLHGLPPTLDELEHVHESHAELVDRLLSSPRYGNAGPSIGLM